jgi:acetate kinase
MSETILVVNAGSSSIKFQLFSVGAGDELRRRLKGQIEGIGVHPRLVAKGVGGETLIDKVGHRVVHGGPDYSEPILIDDAVIERLQAFAPLAPLHQPNNLGPIRTLRQRQLQLPQIACFDTAFHRGRAEIADRYALPEQFSGVRRYGFHGLSYEYIASQLPSMAPDIAKGRVVVAHLGSGASMCAMHAGKSVESTMGFTALDGSPMGTRPGQLDAGIVIYLLTEKGMSAGDIEHLFYHDCGLKGLSGISNDVRDLLASSDLRAKRALDYFVYRIATVHRDAGGSHERHRRLGVHGRDRRECACHSRGRRAALSWLHLDLDPEANAKGAGRISRERSRLACYVIPTDEELMIARHTLRVLHGQAAALLMEKHA